MIKIISKRDKVLSIVDGIKNTLMSSQENWCDFLRVTSRFNKYIFYEQLLIYAQRPDATACATFETWNHLNCRIKKGTKGILLYNLRDHTDRYVFDVSDVIPQNSTSIPRFWKFESEYKEDILASLSREFELNKEVDSFPEYIKELTDSIVEAEFQGNPNIELMQHKEFISSSMTYSILSRCGIPKEDYIDIINFQNIEDIKEWSIVSSIGVQVRNLTSPIYNVISSECNRLYEERSNDYGYNIQTVRGLSTSESQLKDERGRSANEIRKDEERLSSGRERGHFLNHDTRWDSSITSSGDTKSGRGNDGPTNRGNEDLGRSNRGTESKQSTSLGADDEQHQIESRGNSHSGDYTQLNLFDSIINSDSPGSYGESGVSSKDSSRTRRYDEFYNQDSNVAFFCIDTEKYYTVTDGHDGYTYKIYDKDLNLLEGNIYENSYEFSNIREFAYDIFELSPARVEELNYTNFVQQMNDKQSAVFSVGKSNVEKSNVEEFSDDQSSNVSTVHDVSSPAASNFHIEDEKLGTGSLKEKFLHNVIAIKTMQQIERENRVATLDEQKLLSKYVGWGGLSQAFDPKNDKWSNEYEELKNLLSYDEFVSARSSTLNAHYTAPSIISSIYDVLSNMGFEKGRILEPALGIGNFFGMIPNSMKDSSLYGVELDSISGRIAKLLYPNANIQITGYENTNFKNDYFDVAIGNVPFGNYNVTDNTYKDNYLIHDYFFVKTLDKVRPGGVIAFITSKGTLDKHNSSVRRYISDRAELLGAIRLPNNAFSANAGTDVTSDIIFLKKRERAIVSEDSWINVGFDSNGIEMNQYFIDHPDMVLGTMEMVSGQYGMVSICVPKEQSLKELLDNAIPKIRGTYDKEALIQEVDLPDTIVADPNTRNFSYGVVNGQVFYREGDSMTKVSRSVDRLREIIKVRDITRSLIDVQLKNGSDQEVSRLQSELNAAYDKFSDKFGLINSRANKLAFDKDSSYYLLCSLEVLDENQKLLRKADIFNKRTIRIQQDVYSVETPNEALAVCINVKGHIDFDYMKSILNQEFSNEDIINHLEGVIFLNPATNQYETQDEYLSGNVRKKLYQAERAAENDESFQVNVDMLRKFQPKDLEASEIDVRLGATWIDPKYINQFVVDLLKPPPYMIRSGEIEVNYSEVRGLWNISGKNSNSSNVLANVNYGTKRANAYRLIEDALNLKDTKIFDVQYEDGKEVRVLNKKETILAQQKQSLIKEEFKDWIFKDRERRTDLCKKYNEVFNSIVPRTYNGEHLTFPGMNTDICLKPNQKNAVARGIYGGNSLFAHAVGAGKTFAMAATCMKSKQLGLSQKAMFVVPKSLVGQWANEFLLLYPGANLLVASAKDFTPENRKKFCSRIATGNYDAVIISHSQFDKIPLSKERQTKYITEQINKISIELENMGNRNGERFTIKQMELTRKSLQAKLDKLNSSVAKDNVVTFEELGVDRLFVDEAHSYKNLFLYTKMNNVAGISQTDSEKSSDMFNKCRYINEITNNKGVVFATGTPVSNSMSELYTMMRYLQYDTLEEMNLVHFDSWASTFGETVTAMELSVEGNSYRTKTRFSKFYNVPELMNIFKEVADIQTADMLNLPVPEAEYITDIQKPTQEQKDILQAISERADRIRSGSVDPSEDNMLKLTNDGRKLALDQRLINPLLEDNPNSKVNACINNVFSIWNDTKNDKLTQMIFCDLSTPNKNEFNVYDDIKTKLISRGVPEKEIAFIHDADTEAKKSELFKKVRSGNIRVLLGSTQKLGTGTNVQTKLVAVHHLDPPWRPSDIEQREGRIIRQGNENKKVKIYRYATEGTFDAYSWQMLENKQKFISQIMTSKSPVRSCADVDEAVLSYSEVKALATGNPLIKEKMDLDTEVSKLKLLKANFASQIYRLEDEVYKVLPANIKETESQIGSLQKDLSIIESHLNDEFAIMLDGKVYHDKKEAGEEIIKFCSASKRENMNFIGTYKDFNIGIKYDGFYNSFILSLSNHCTYTTEIGLDPIGNISRMNNLLSKVQSRLEHKIDVCNELKSQLALSTEELKKEFPYEQELISKTNRLSELNLLLSDNKDNSALQIDEKSIIKDIKMNKLDPVPQLVDNISQLSRLEGKQLNVKEIKKMYITAKNDNFAECNAEKSDLLKTIFKECRQQQHEYSR